jgi:16S rRNA processing protein RimM
LKCEPFPRGVEPKTVYIGGKNFAVAGANYQNFTYLYLAGVTTIDDAERLRNKAIEIDRADMKIPDDEILTSDLVGYAVVCERGEHLGIIKAVENYGAGEIIDCGSFMFPYEDDFVVETDTKNRVLTVKKAQIHAEF